MPKSTHALYLEIKEHGALVACAPPLVIILHPEHCRPPCWWAEGLQAGTNQKDYAMQ